MPKVKGSICNVPVDTNKVYNVLPRASDNTGIIMVKLKRKLIYIGHVLFEPVRPVVVRQVLDVGTNCLVFQDNADSENCYFY